MQWTGEESVFQSLSPDSLSHCNDFFTAAMTDLDSEYYELFSALFVWTHVVLTPTFSFSPVSAVTLPLLFLHEHCDEPVMVEGVSHIL